MTGPNNPRRCLRCQDWHAPGRHGAPVPARVEIELRGGPADGMQLTVDNPPPALIRVPVPSPVGWADPRLDYGYPVAALDVLLYEVRDTWNPRTRRRQYGIG